MVELEEIYASLRPKMMRVAYHMLGTLPEAEDAVQDVFAILQAMDKRHIEHEQPYVIQMLVNRCRNHLGTAAHKREVYAGQWLPEPLISAENVDALRNSDPVYVLERNESVSYAMMVLFERLSPLERAVFVLRQVFAYTYPEISFMVDRSIANCRKIYSRARKSLQLGESYGSDSDALHIGMTDKFMRGMSTGDFGDFIQALAKDTQMITDGGGNTKAAIYPVYGVQKVSRFLQGLYRKGTFNGLHQVVRVNGQPGILLFKQQRLYGVICLDVNEAHITRIYMVLNPEKLLRMTSAKRSPC